MKGIHTVLRILLILSLTSPVFPAIKIKVEGGPYKANPGGEYTITILDTDTVTLPIGYEYQSFCVETAESVSLGSTYYAVLNTVAVEGGAGSGLQDPLDPKTAWLFYQFSQEILTNYEFSDPTGRRASAWALQQAIWSLEEEQGMPTPGTPQADFIALANAASPTSIASVRVLNLYNDANLTQKAQDMLIVPPRLGKIIIEKVVNPECLDRCEESPTFSFSGDVTGSIGHSEQIIVTHLLTGEYTVTETTPDDWIIDNIMIDDNNSTYVISGDGKSGTVTFRIETGETVKAVFTNTRPSVSVSLSAGIGGVITSPGEGIFEYCMGHEICLNAESTDPLFEFVGWSGTLTLPISQDCNNTMIMGPTNICGAIGYGPIVPHCTGCFKLKLIHNYAIKAVFISVLDTLYVDDDGPSDPAPYDNTKSDPNENGTPEHPFDMIQEAIDVAKENAMIVVREGQYGEIINYLGKCITVTSIDPEDSSIPLDYPTIHGPANENGGHVVSFRNCEDPNTTLTGFIITGGYGLYTGGINCFNSCPTIQNCIIIGNRSHSFQGSGAALYSLESSPVFMNCVIYGNVALNSGAGGLYSIDSEIVVLNSILYNNPPEEIITQSSTPVVAYSNIKGGYPGDGNIDEDPQFVLPGFWEHTLNPGFIAHPANPYAAWTHGDYHLQPTSPCIDTGDPMMPYHNEPAPDGGRINMGAYGGTIQATSTE